jgi:sugar phosphate isomerase/epimerase
VDPQLTASFVTLSGAGFAEPARHPIEERCAAAAEAGFTGIGLHVGEFEQEPARTARAQRAVADHGLAVVEVEFLSGWAGGSPDAERVQRQAHRLADLFGIHHLSAGEFDAAEGDFDLPAAASRFAQVCDRAAQHALVLALEAFPWSPIRDVATARQILLAAGAANAGLLIDVWHFFNTGGTLDDLDDLPPSAIAAVQLNDGPRVHENYLWNARNTRWLPGRGGLDVVGLLRLLDRIGYAGPYCVEVNFPEYRALPAAEAARQAFGAAAEVLEEARGGG